ncbi:MAG: DNA repair protein RecN [Bacteroidia bacterium]|nr:DNA repair protein RecN [Bacteroidia bacterium]MDW8302054.1 DNA repair protein RecN [Bacteroidia bacterium]
MLRYLHIKNYALIDELYLEFEPELNIISGETGAGKSILMGALGLVLANRADVAVIRQGAEKCFVEANFKLDENSIVHNLMEEYQLDRSDEITIRREITNTGKSRAFINDTPVNLQVLKHITHYLVDFNGQDQDQELMHPAEQLRMLDVYGDSLSEREKFKSLYDTITQLEQQIEQKKQEAIQNKQNLDFYLFQYEELENAHIQPDELPELEAELQTLENASKIAEAIHYTQQVLYEGENNIHGLLKVCQQKIDKVSTFYKRLEKISEEINHLRYSIEDIVSQLTELSDQLNTDPKREDFIHKRIDTYYHLMRKHNANTVEDLIAKKNILKEKINHIETIDEDISALIKEKENLCKEASALALKLYQKRRKAAEAISKAIEENLKQVGISSPKLVVQSYINEQPDGWIVIDGKHYKPHPYGIDSVIFLLSTNIGIQPGPIHKIASGGEIARVMLALKASLADKMQLPTLIFDEIDSGVSGEVALKVGKLLERIAQHHQIISITHLAQVASRGKTHFFVYKENENQQPVTRVKKLTPDERISEIAKLIAGSKVTESAKQNAIELLNS